MAAIKDMAEAHLRNVQQQISDLEQQKLRIDEDIQKLGVYLQQGVAELNSDESVDSSEGATITPIGVAPVFSAPTASTEEEN